MGGADQEEQSSFGVGGGGRFGCGGGADQLGWLGRRCLILGPPWSWASLKFGPHKRCTSHPCISSQTAFKAATKRSLPALSRASAPTISSSWRGTARAGSSREAPRWRGSVLLPGGEPAVGAE